jgi:hypothetical protein
MTLYIDEFYSIKNVLTITKILYVYIELQSLANKFHLMAYWSKKDIPSFSLEGMQTLAVIINKQIRKLCNIMHTAVPRENGVLAKKKMQWAKIW